MLLTAFDIFFLSKRPLDLLSSAPRLKFTTDTMNIYGLLLLLYQCL